MVKRTVLINGQRKVITVSMRRPAEDVRPSMAQHMGLRGMDDALDLKSSVALVIDQETNEVLFQKNTQAVLPIASITKLMTALVVLDAKMPDEEILRVGEEDRDLEKGSSSRLRVGTEMTRRDMLLLALMSSENRAASALSRYYPGGKPAFVKAMNRKAVELNMADTKFADPTGLTSHNVSSAGDLVKLVNAAYTQPLIRQFSTQTEYEVTVGGRPQHFINTNRLVRGGEWDIGVQKTGYISEAGRCLVMQAKVLSRPVVMVFLDSVGKVSRFADAVRVRHWLENSGIGLTRSAPSVSIPAAAVPHAALETNPRAAIEAQAREIMR
ncbi:MAG: D-alanyl-D-alanine endopeptidase [Candidatus Protistobacter heckmanni]|nr:D-alanyl-D-alanine endopeptidase [Candidatus Protistobacter heckmanni]